MQGIVCAAPQSGSGKTVVTQALIRALTLRGWRIYPAKCGPDYIDPQFLDLACKTDCDHQSLHQPSGRCVNLDFWAMRSDSIKGILQELDDQSQNEPRPKMLVVEGVMGLFDGAANGVGSTADLAAKLSLPIILIIDASKQSGSVAALVQGFAGFRDGTQILGVILNKVGSARHEQMLRRALSDSCPDIKVIASLPRDPIFELAERHLGLVQMCELTDYNKQLDAMAAKFSDCCDFSALEEILMPWPVSVPDPDLQISAQALLPLKVQHLAIAYDQAFSFIYAAQYRQWLKQGHEISFFSPLSNQAPSSDADGILLLGGYPELHLETIRHAEQFHQGMLQAAKLGIPIHGECGGYMVLGESITTASGDCVPMLGLLSGNFHLQKKRRALGYRRVALQSHHLFGHCGDILRGHEFHYGANQDPRAQDEEALFQASDALGAPCSETGVVRVAISGSFIHLLDQESSAILRA